MNLRRTFRTTKLRSYINEFQRSCISRCFTGLINRACLSLPRSEMMADKMLLNILKVLLVLAFFTPPVKAYPTGIDNNVSDTIRILTIGNSFADNACRYLKQITESVEGCDIIIGKANIGGCYLEKHATLMKQSERDSTFKPYGGKSLKDYLLMDDWDVVTIQQVSHMSFKVETYLPYADEIREYIKKYAPRAKIYIHETWAYAADCPRFKDLKTTQKKMYRRLRKNYKSLSKRYDSQILPSGDAFHKAHKRNGIDLWSEKDRFHASSNGCYLAGCVWFSKLFDAHSPEEISFLPKNMSAETADYLKSIVRKTK